MRRMVSKFVVVASYARPMDAHLTRTRLEAEGIRALLWDEQTITVDPLSALALGGVKVTVAANDAARAREILGNLD